MGFVSGRFLCGSGLCAFVCGGLCGSGLCGEFVGEVCVWEWFVWAFVCGGLCGCGEVCGRSLCEWFVCARRLSESVWGGVRFVVDFVNGFFSYSASLHYFSRS